MAKVMTFSTKFPDYHPRAGEPTFFVEKIWNGLRYQYIDVHAIYKAGYLATLKDGLKYSESYYDESYYDYMGYKHHTIRAGNRWKVGDKFSPRIWSGTPYRSKQIIIAPDIEVKKVWDFEMYSTDKHSHVHLNGVEFNPPNIEDFYKLMRNDGLEPEDFRLWFQLSKEYKKKKRFRGQIICWNENLEY